MNRTITLIYFALLINVSFAQNGDTLDANSIRAFVNPNGLLFNQNNVAGFEVPKTVPLDSSIATNTIFSHTLWISATDSAGQLYSSAAQDAQTDFSYGPISNSYTSAAYQNKYNRVWKISRTMVQDHLANRHSPGYVIPEVIKNWPGNDLSSGTRRYLAPFIDVDADATYDPETGDYPCFRGDNCIYIIFNDEANGQAFTGGSPMQLEIHAMVYTVNDTVGALNETVFVGYSVRNFSQHNYSDMYFGAKTDFDLGCATDDYIGCDTVSNLYYAYNGDPIDDVLCSSNGYGSNLPIQGCAFLNRPMNHFMHYQNNTSVMGNPNSDLDFSNYLQGKWRDNTNLTFGGTGYGGINTTNFMHPSDPNLMGGWSECAMANMQHNVKGVGSTRIGAFNKQTAYNVDLAFVFDDGYAFCDPITNYTTKLNTVKAYFNGRGFSDTTLFIDCSIVTHIDEIENQQINFNIYPNPTTKAISVDYKSSSGEVAVQIFDLKGNELLGNTLKNLDELENGIGVDGLASGAYLLRIIDYGKVGVRKFVVHK